MEDIRNKVLVGDAREKLKELPENSIDMVMTSPPYNQLVFSSWWGMGLA